MIECRPWAKRGESRKREAKESNGEDNSAPDGNEMHLGIPNSSGTPKALRAPISSGGEEVYQESL